MLHPMTGVSNLLLIDHTQQSHLKIGNSESAFNLRYNFGHQLIPAKYIFQHSEFAMCQQNLDIFSVKKVL